MTFWRLCVLLALGLNALVVFMFFATEGSVSTWAATVSALFVLYFVYNFHKMWWL
jgi:hypothetical protein